MPHSTDHTALRVPVSAVVVILLFACTAMAQLSERDRGIALYLDREYAQAVEVLTPVLAADKKDKMACIYLASAHFKLKETDAVKKVSRQCRKITRAMEPVSDQLYDTRIEIKKKPRATYTEDARIAGVTGQIELLVEFRRDGYIGSIITIRELPGGLTENTLAVARAIEFEPATRNGEPVDDVLLISYRFDIY